MRKISTGQDSTLGTYLKMAKVFGPKCEKFFQDKIDSSPIGEDEEVIADESQMVYLMASMVE